MPDRRRLGREAEDRAAAFLLEKGYTLVTRRYTAKGGEIDLIVLDGDLLVFVEVKARSGRGLRPEEAIDDRKARHLVACADAYLDAVGEQTRVIRYDLVAIDDEGTRHYEDFFRPGF